MSQQSERSRRWGEMMRGSQNGQTEVYTTLLAEVRGVLLSYFIRRGLDGAAAEDLVQETLIALHRARHTYLPERSFTAWLFAIAQNKLIDYSRARKSRISLAMDVDEQEFECIEAGVEMADPIVLSKALSELPLKQRMVVMIHKVSGLSVRNTAMKLGITESDVKVTAHRARTSLFEKLGT